MQDSKEDMSDSVILTESDCYQEEQIHYDWTNILQSYAMLWANLIFIGFSGADNNFRRLIKYVNRENSLSQKRYIFFAVDDAVNAVLKERIRKAAEEGDDVVELLKEEKEYAFESLHGDGH